MMAAVREERCDGIIKLLFTLGLAHGSCTSTPNTQFRQESWGPDPTRVISRCQIKAEARMLNMFFFFSHSHCVSYRHLISPVWFRWGKKERERCLLSSGSSSFREGVVGWKNGVWSKPRRYNIWEENREGGGEEWGGVEGSIGEGGGLIRRTDRSSPQLRLVRLVLVVTHQSSMCLDEAASC